MASYIFHFTHLFYLVKYISPETRKLLPEDFLTLMLIGVILPDLAKRKEKDNTHYSISHPVYCDEYKIPNIEMVYAKYLEKNPVKLGILAHLVYDLDHINEFLIRYAKPCNTESEIHEAQLKLGIQPSKEYYYYNTVADSYITGSNLFGNWDDKIGELYKLYNKFNAVAVSHLMPMLNEEYGTQFKADKEGFLQFIDYIFPEQVPITEITEMERCRGKSDIKSEIKGFFDDDGSDCKFEAEIDDMFTIIKTSASKLAKKIDKLYIT